MVAQEAYFDNSFWKVAWKGNMKLMNELWRQEKCHGNKSYKNKRISKVHKKNYEKRNLNLNPNLKHENKNKNMK